MKVLLSSPMIPYPSFKGGRDTLHHNYSKVTLGQGIFSIPVKCQFPGIHLIARNISPYAMVLQDPDQKLFIKELKKRYDIIGLYFTVPFFSKILAMCKLIRQYSGSSKIVLGGPGVQCLEHSTGVEEEMRSLVDYVCYGEGIEFLRKLTGDNTKASVWQDIPPGVVVPLRCKFLRTRTLLLASTLGCNNGCEFCSASAFFGHKRINIATPEEVYRDIRNYLVKYPKVTSARMLDDNFLAEKEYVKTLGKYLRDDPLCRQRRFTISTFANLSAISLYTAEELAEYCIAGLLIGVESKFTDKLSTKIKRKKKGINVKEVFESLKDHGIFIEGSTILGWDFHNKENIIEDIDYYISLQATFDQIVCLIPCPGTPLWEKLKKEGRLSKDISWDDAGFYVKWHNYKNFKHEELWAYEDYATEKVFKTWGPSYLRLLDVHLRGYRTFKTRKESWCKARADFHRMSCIKMAPLLRSIKRFSPSENVSARVEDVKNRYISEFGKPKFSKRILSYAALLICAYRTIERKLIKEDIIQPKPRVTIYPSQIP